MKSNAPYENFKAVTPHAANTLKDHNNENMTTRAVIVAVAGLVACRIVGTETVVNIHCAAGIPVPVVTDLIHTDSTATGIVALW